MKKGMIALYMGIFGNIALFVLKLTIGIFSGSIALTNDAFHSLSDFLTTSIALLGFKTSLKPADISHPYGHHKAEPLVGLGVALSLAGMGVLLAYDAISNDDKLLKEIKQKTMEVSGVLDVHRVRARQLGEEVALDMHVDVDPEISVLEAHEIAHSVQKKLEELEEVESALVHICPYGTKIGEED